MITSKSLGICIDYKDGAYTIRRHEGRFERVPEDSFPMLLRYAQSHIMRSTRPDHYIEISREAKEQLSDMEIMCLEIVNDIACERNQAEKLRDKYRNSWNSLREALPTAVQQCISDAIEEGDKDE